MKTREQFVLLAEAYQVELRRRGLVLLPFMVLMSLLSIVLAEVLDYYLKSDTVLVGIWIVLFFSMLLGVNFYQAKSQQSLARKFELFCPACSRVITVRYLNVAIATHNCPYCGASVYS
jgi:MFS-type transporter involved in bile tolerance (Atg22 family)